MSSKKSAEERKEDASVKASSTASAEGPTTTVRTGSSPTSTIPTQNIAEYASNVNKALDETKNNIRKSIDEVRAQIPRYTTAANEYQEQTIQTAREITESYLDAQKEIVNSFQSAINPHVENFSRIVNYCLTPSPKALADVYARAVTSFADNIITATRLTNNMVFGNVRTFNALLEQVADNSKEFSRIGVNAARALEQTSRDIAAAATVSSSSTTANAR
jgi:hypothetical protein